MFAFVYGGMYLLVFTLDCEFSGFSLVAMWAHGCLNVALWLLSVL